MIKEIVQGAREWWEQANANFKETEERLEVSESGIEDVNTKVDEIEENQNGISGKVVELEQRANPNLLINSNFKVSELVNQRGETVYSNGGYTVDMWNKTTGIVDLQGEYVKVDDLSRLSTTIENFKQLQGKKVTITLSSRYTNNIGNGWFRIVINQSSYKVGTINKTNTFENVSISTTLPENIEHFRLDIYGIDAEIEISYFKMEYGEQATPFIDDDPATKLAKCQRYLQRVGPFRNFAPFSIRSNDIAFDLQLVSEMREAPTVIYEELYIFDNYTFSEIDGFTIAYNINKRGGRINANKTNHGLGEDTGRVFLQMKNNGTSGLLLSAEL